MSKKCYCSKKNKNRVLSEIGKRFQNGFRVKELEKDEFLKQRMTRRTLYYCLEKLKNEKKIIKTGYGKYYPINNFLRIMLKEYHKLKNISENEEIIGDYVYELLMNSEDLDDSYKYVVDKYFKNQFKKLLSDKLDLPIAMLTTKYEVDTLSDKELRKKFIDIIMYEFLDPEVINYLLENNDEEKLQEAVHNDLKLALSLKNIFLERLSISTREKHKLEKNIRDYKKAIKVLRVIINSRLNGKNINHFNNLG